MRKHLGNLLYAFVILYCDYRLPGKVSLWNWYFEHHIEPSLPLAACGQYDDGQPCVHGTESDYDFNGCFTHEWGS